MAGDGQPLRPRIVRKLWPVSAWLNWFLARGWSHYRTGQTVSEHAAIGQGLGYRPACLLCGVLHILLERDHCSRSIPKDPTCSD